jgi:hypothetical protein
MSFVKQNKKNECIFSTKLLTNPFTTSARTLTPSSRARSTSAADATSAPTNAFTWVLAAPLRRAATAEEEKKKEQNGIKWNNKEQNGTKWNKMEQKEFPPRSEISLPALDSGQQPWSMANTNGTEWKKHEWEQTRMEKTQMEKTRMEKTRMEKTRKKHEWKKHGTNTNGTNTEQNNCTYPTEQKPPDEIGNGIPSERWRRRCVFVCCRWPLWWRPLPPPLPPPLPRQCRLGSLRRRCRHCRRCVASPVRLENQ